MNQSHVINTNMGQIGREDPPRTKVRLASCALQRQVQSPAAQGYWVTGSSLL